MELEEYLPRIRGAVRLFIEGGLQENDSDMRVKVETGLSEIKAVVTDIVNGPEDIVGITKRKLLNEVAYLCGYQDGEALKLSLGIEEEKKPEHIPPPPP